MRIAHVFPYDPRHLGQDFERWAETQLRRWPLAAVVRSRHAPNATVHVIGPRGRLHSTSALEISEHRAWFSGPRFRDWGDDWSWSLDRLLRRLGPRDVCVLHLNDYSAARLAERAASGCRVALVFHGRGLRAWETADALVVLREDAAAALVADGAEPHRISVMSPSVDTAIFRAPAPGAARSDSLLGFVGRLEQSKGIGDLERVLQALPGVTIEAAGSGDADLPGVIRLGEIPASEVAERMRRWRLLLLPSYTEGHSLVALEAVASGLPLAAVEGVLPSELAIRRGVHLAPRADYPALVKRLLSEPPRPPDSAGVRSHEDAAEAWDTFLESLPEWRPRSRPKMSNWARVRRFRPPRRLARRILRR